LGDDLRLRLYLHNLSKSTESNYETLEIAEQLKTLMSTTEAPAILGNSELPPAGDLAEVLIKIKTELVVNTWRDKLIPPRYEEITAEIERLFGSFPHMSEEPRCRELCTAALNPGYRESIAHYHPKGSAHLALQRYVSRIQNAIGPTLLEMINNDINARRYMPGLGGGSAIGLASPKPQVGQGDVRLQGPTLQDGQSGKPKTVRNLNQAMNELHAKGGVDPLAHAQEVAAGAAETLRLLHAGDFGNQAPATSRPEPGSGGGLPPPLQMPNVHRSALPPLPDRRDVTTPVHAAPGTGGMIIPRSGLNSENNRLRSTWTDESGREVSRRHTVRWSHQEVEDLLRCCDQYGPTSWARMKHENAGIFVYRSQVDLKDKWRNLLNSKDQRIQDRCAQIKLKWQRASDLNSLPIEPVIEIDDEEEENENEGNGAGPGQQQDGQDQNIATGGDKGGNPGPSAGRRETRRRTKEAAVMEEEKRKLERDDKGKNAKKTKGGAKK
jgi:hypothetical protein